MSNLITYSILQYNHSLLLGEVVNIGVLFYFPQEKTIKFVYNKPQRPKSIYPNFDSTTFNRYIRVIESRVKQFKNDLHSEISLLKGFNEFINNHILKEDATALQFTPAQQIINTFDSSQEAIHAYSNLFLPMVLTTKPAEKESDKHIVKGFESLIRKSPVAWAKFEKKPKLKHNDIELVFDLSWKNGSTNLIKALSFDLTDKFQIQRKTAEYCSYLGWFKNYSLLHNTRFDLLISQPKNKQLFQAYNKAQEMLTETQAPLKLITPAELKRYSEYAIEELIKQNN